MKQQRKLLLGQHTVNTLRHGQQARLLRIKQRISNIAGRSATRALRVTTRARGTPEK